MINYFEAGKLPKRKSYKDMFYAKVTCKNSKEADYLFKVLDEVADWNRVEGINQNGRRVTISFFKKELKKNVKSKKEKVPGLQ